MQFSLFQIRSRDPFRSGEKQFFSCWSIFQQSHLRWFYRRLMEGIKGPIFSFSILTYIYFLVASSICTLASSQTDTLSRNETIGIGQTLVSANKVFQLGFFTTGDSEHIYFGIGIGPGIGSINGPERTVWVANRENPVYTTDSTRLTIQDDGNLAVISREYIFWSTNVSIASNTTTAVLLDTGNLVLKEGNSRDSGRYIWQSFDHPTHILLPGMKVGINLRTKQTQTLKSWKNDGDPTPGNFEFGIDVDGLKQFFIYRRSIPYLRAVFWNGSAYDDTSRWFWNGIEINYSVADSETEVYFTITINDRIADSETWVNQSSSAIPMLVMTPRGYLKYAVGQSSSIDTWTWIGKNDVCSFPGGCGAYSTCNLNSRPVCKCLPGFEKAGSGCRRKTVLKCGREDGVLVLKRVEMPEPGIGYGAQDEGDCRERCLSSSCDCKAYAFSNQSGCVAWEDDLKDIREEEHTQEELVVQDIVGIPVAASDLKPNGSQCSNCGANIIPYPLSTDFKCGHPNYNALFCNASSGQLSFRTLNGSYLISSINADTRTLVIMLEGVDLCWARSTKRGDIHLNGSQPFRVTSNNTILLFNCSTSESSALVCNDSSACHRYIQEGRVPCYNQEKCCSYVSTNSPYSVGVLSNRCNAYASIVNLDLSTSTYEWWEGVEVSWDPLPDGDVRVNYSNTKRRFPMIISTTITVGVFSLGTIFYFLWRKIKEKGDAKSHRSPDISTFGENNRKDLDVPFYEFRSVLQATENFSESNKIGQGGFGHVYKGKLSEGQEIAAKKLSRNSGQGQQEFKNEVMLIAKLQHRNLVRLLGYCIKEDELILLYEYMPNKSLDYFLFDSDRRKLLHWEKRHNIILGIAKGLLYLHEDSRLRIIHRDLKTSNILLDEEMRPKISDFGLARIYAGNQIHENTNRVVGTYGYMSPEYAFHGLFSVKSDVFSFGVILLEIISGKKNSLIVHNEESLTLLGHAWKLWKEEKWMDFVDENLSEACELLELKRCLQIGLLCVQENSADRPNMASVVSMFISETATLQAPKQPAFITTSLPNPSSSSSSKNEVTISTFGGR